MSQKYASVNFSCDEDTLLSMIDEFNVAYAHIFENNITMIIESSHINNIDNDIEYFTTEYWNSLDEAFSTILCKHHGKMLYRTLAKRIKVNRHTGQTYFTEKIITSECYNILSYKKNSVNH